MLTTTGFKAMLRQTAERDAVLEKRRMEQYAKRPGWSALAAKLDLHEGDLEAANDSLRSLEAEVEMELAAARSLVAQTQSARDASEGARRELLTTAPDGLAAELRMFSGRLEKAKSFLAEPPPAMPQLLLLAVKSDFRFSLPPGAQFEPQDEVRKRHEKQIAEHRARVQACEAYVAAVSPIVDKLRALALTPDPTEDELDEILAALDPDLRLSKPWIAA